MSQRFQRERLDDALSEVIPLTVLHYEEIAHYLDIPLKPDWDIYRNIEGLGNLRVFTARDEATQELIGYAFFYVKHNIHYSTSLQASQDILFIHPDKRGFGSKFIAWCDDQLKLEGVQAVYHHVKKKHNFGPLLEKLGYELVDLIYARRLDK